MGGPENDQPKGGAGEGPPMLAQEAQLAPVDLAAPALRRLVGALAGVVPNPRRRDVANPPPGLREAEAPIRLLGVHKVFLVEEPDLIDRGAPHHQAGAG